MSGVVGPNVDSNDDTERLLILGQESSGTSCLKGCLKAALPIRRVKRELWAATTSASIREVNDFVSKRDRVRRGRSARRIRNR
jgi:hypothetical protein